VVPDRPLPVPDPEVDIRIRWRLPRPLSVWRKAWETHFLQPGAEYGLRQCRTAPLVHNYAPFSSAHHQSTVYWDGRAHDVPEEAPDTTRAARARRGERRAGRRWPAAPRLLRTCSVDVSGMPARLRAVAMRSPKHRRAARAVDIACSTRCQELERLTWSSPRIGSACLLHVRCNAACLRF
jgi:hypothetical protein